MRSNLGLLHTLYRWLLKLYPNSFREEYEEELQVVFDLSINDANKTGRLETARVVLRELTTLPRSAFFEHLRERRKSRMNTTVGSRFDFVPGSRIEIFTALAPFLFGMVMVILGYLGNYMIFPLWMQIVFVILFWSSVVTLFLLGSAKGLPRWFLPYLGLPLPIISLLLFNSLMEKLQGVWWYRLSWLLSAFVQEGLLWMGLVFMLVLLLVLTRLIPRSRPFYQRLKNDWTLLSFVIYGTMPLALAFTLNEYKNEEPFMFIALSILAAAAWLYLQSDEPWYRFFCLQGGIWLSMLVAAIGKAVLVESSFPDVLDNAWQIEFTSTIITGIWLTMIMLIPYAFHRLTRGDHSSQLSQCRG